MEINAVLTKDKLKVIGAGTMMVEAMAQLRSSPSSALIVSPENPSDAYGIVTIRDVVYKGLAKGLDPNVTPISRVMTKPVLILNNLNLELRYVAMAMANAEVDHVLVFDKDHMVGGLSLYDVLVSMWKECSRQKLNDMVADVGGGC